MASQKTNYLFIYLGFYVSFNTVQVISRRVVGRAEKTSTYSWSRFCTVNCRSTASKYQLSHLGSGQEPNPDLRDGRRVLPLCHHGPQEASGGGGGGGGEDRNDHMGIHRAALYYQDTRSRFRAIRMRPSAGTRSHTYNYYFTKTCDLGVTLTLTFKGCFYYSTSTGESNICTI